MKAKLLTLLVIFLASPVGEALACAVCYGARDSKSTENMAIAVWVMMGVVLSVLGGVGAFSLHLWRHAHTPLQPHEELVEENLEQYE